MADGMGFSPSDTVTFTGFRTKEAKDKWEVTETWGDLVHRIRFETKQTKGDLPWLKLARFGSARTSNGSLRHDANVVEITGIEGDYDGEQHEPAYAIERLHTAGVKALVYTSPSHTEGAPRWRVLCPVSRPLPPEQRAHLMGRLNGLLGGVLSGESFTLSQAYFYGSVRMNPSHAVDLVEGRPIDLCDELDAGWMGKPGTGESTSGPDGKPRGGRADQAKLLEEIVSGETFHAATVRLAGVWAFAGVSLMDARTRLFAAFDAVPLEQRGEKWRTRRADVERCLLDIYEKDAKKQGSTPGRKQGPPPGGTAPEEPWPEPIDFLADNEIAGVPELGADHLPDAIAPFVFDTAERMGVEPASVALAAIVSIASVISDDWQVQPKQHDTTWTEQARLWGAIIGAPSILKTPVLRAASKPIDRLDMQARQRHAEDMRKWRQEVAALKQGKVPPPYPPQPRCDRYLAESVTVEALSEILRDDEDAKSRAPAHKVLVRVDEMSEWVAGFDQYKGGGKGGADRGAYLRLYNGGRHTIDRIGRGSFAIPNWSACILGGIQPEPIQRIAKDAADDGLLQRFLFIVPAGRGEDVDRQPNTDALERYGALFPALAVLGPPRFLSGEARPVTLDIGAHRQRVAINGVLRAHASMPDVSGQMQAALEKWPGTFARLALVFHLIDIADAHARQETPPPLGVLREETAQRAASFMQEVLLPHLLRAEALLYSTVQAGHVHWVAKYILASEECRQTQRVTVRDVQRAYRPLKAPEHRREVVEVLTALEVAGWLRVEPRENPTQPLTTWVVHPALHANFADRAAKERARRDAAKEEAIRNMQRGRAAA